MTDFQNYSTHTIRNLIEDTETTLGQLKAELQRREEAKQKLEIKNLETHLKSAEFSLRSIREFFALLVDDHRNEK
ncbi:MAG: hypothetical protein ACF8AM_06705 [Rhodopirellula sp. JB055]|uniref:hypothetical protein n=1 Tax=Rhodopirellula sp. JB055 TaxID=3342846 RepID=UPI00370AB338